MFLFMKQMYIKLLNTSKLFFLITNFGCWIGSTTYPQNFAGLMECYVMGIPFLKGTLLSDLFYCGVLFGSFEFIKIKVPAIA